MTTAEAAHHGAPRRTPGFLKNALANYAGQLVTLAIGIVLTPVLVHHLGTAGYGIWALVVAIQNLGGLVDFGVTESVVRYVATYHAQEDVPGINRVVNTLLGLHLALGCLAGAATTAFAFFGLPLLHLDAAQLAQARPALLVAAAGLLVGLPLGVLGTTLVGLRQYVASNSVTLVQALGGAAATLVALELGGTVTSLIAINAVLLAGGHAARYLLATRRLPGLRVDLRLGSRATLRTVTGYSVWLFVLDVAERLFYNADNLVIAAFLPVTALTDYSFGFKAASAVSYLAGPAVAVLLPTASALSARARTSDLTDVLAAGTRLATAVTIPAALWLALWGRQVFEVWVGPGHDRALPVLWLFLAAFLSSATQSTSAVVLRGIGRVRTLAIVVGMEYVANLALSVLFVRHIGAAGAALGTLLPALFVGVFVTPRLVCRALGASYLAFASKALTRPILAALPVAAILLALRIVLTSPSLLVLLGAALAAVASYVLVYWKFAAGPEERRVFDQIASKRHRGAHRDAGRHADAERRHSDARSARVAARDAEQPARPDGVRDGLRDPGRR